MDEDKCENCHKKGKRQFKIIEPGITYGVSNSDERENISGTFCTVACAKASGLTKMPKEWKVQEIKE